MYNAYIQPSHSCKGFRSKTLKAMPCSGAHYCPSSETQGQIKGARESLNGRRNIYGTKKSKEQREEPLGTMSYQTSSKRSPPFWLLIGARKTQVFWHQSEARTAATVGTGLVRHCPQGLFSPFLTFLRAIFFRPFRLSLAPFICPWVSEDDSLPNRYMYLAT